MNLHELGLEKLSKKSKEGKKPGDWMKSKYGGKEYYFKSTAEMHKILQETKGIDETVKKLKKRGLIKEVK